MPSTLVEIKKRAFSSCNELSEIILNDGLKIIQNVVYSGSKLMSIIIPESVEYIDKYAFSNNTNGIKEITKFLNDNIHKYGGTYNINEVAKRLCGKELDQKGNFVFVDVVFILLIAFFAILVA